MPGDKKLAQQSYRTGKEALYKNDPYYVVRDPTYAHKDAVPVEIFPLNEENYEKVVMEPHKYSIGLVQNQRVNNIVVVGANNNLSGQLKNLANQREGGPYYADGRDGVLTLHNKKTNRPVSKVYTYAGGNGELIDFNVSSKYTTTTVSLAQSSGINPDTKSQENLQTQVVATDDIAEGDRGYMLYSDNEYFDATKTNGSIFKGGILGFLSGRWSFGNEKEKGGVWQVSKIDGKRGIKKATQSNKPDTGKRLDPYRPTHIYPDKEIINYLKSTRKVYSSREDALSTEKSINLVTQKELEEYINLLEERGKLLKGELPADWVNWPREEREKWWDDHFHFSKLPSFKIKREITYIMPVEIKGKQKLDFNTNRNYIYNSRVDGNIHSIEKTSSIKSVLRVLGKNIGEETKILAIYDPMMEVSSRDYYKYSPDRMLQVYVEETIELYLNGVEVLASSTIVNDIVNSSWVEQDLLKKTTDAVKANATILGDPSVESSMNIQIQNVSSRYSGVWYTKKVTHKFSDGEGYMMDIEFEKRNIPIKVIKIHSKTNSASKVISWSDAAKEKYKDGTWDLTNRLEIEINTLKAKYPDYPTTLYRQDEKDHTKFTVYMAKEDMSTAKLDEQVSKGDLSGVSVEYIDLKNTQLPEE